jgi:hypothetical protein
MTIRKMDFTLRTGNYYVAHSKAGSPKYGLTKGNVWLYFMGRKHVWYRGGDDKFFHITKWESKEKLTGWLLSIILYLDLYVADFKKEAVGMVGKIKVVGKLLK